MNKTTPTIHPPATPRHTGRLLTDEQLLTELFGEAKPTLRWLRLQREKRTIPYIRVGHVIRYDAAAVRDALDKHHTIRARAAS